MLENEKIIDDIEVELSAILGKSSLTVHEIKEIKPGSVVPLDKAVTDLIEIYAANKLIARGELCSGENGLGVKITEIISS